MDNRFEQVRIVAKRLTPTEAEVHFHVRPRGISPSTELRGRLNGPRCLFSTTIEIAYALRKIDNDSGVELTSRVLIPEPNWWHPDAPFLYEGPLELWESGKCCDRRKIRYGLRSIKWDGNEIQWNGKPLQLRGAAVTDLDGESAASLRRQKHNAVLLNGMISDDIVRLADQHGLLVFQCGQQTADPKYANSPSWMGCIDVDS